MSLSQQSLPETHDFFRTYILGITVFLLWGRSPPRPHGSATALEGLEKPLGFCVKAMKVVGYNKGFCWIGITGCMYIIEPVTRVFLIVFASRNILEKPLENPLKTFSSLCAGLGGISEINSTRPYSLRHWQTNSGGLRLNGVNEKYGRPI